jgi:hypothetical protein
MGTRETRIGANRHPIFNFQFSIFNLHFFLCLLPLLLLAGCKGCRESAPIARDESAEEAVSRQNQEELLSLAIDNLNRLEEFNSPDLFNQLIERLDPRNQPKPGQADAHFDPLLASWPEPEMLRQVVDRINQWALAQQPPAGWKVDPMVATLPKLLRDLPQVKDLDRMEFSRFDGYALQEAVWLRDISHWARGDVMDDLERAKRLFDWTVRNVQLEPDDRTWIPQFPWETLLFGRGTAAERAWVFILLLRQLNIDAAVLAVDEGRGAGDKEQETKTAPDRARRPWCVGVLIEGNVYLFDPLLGLPIPAPNGVTHSADGELAIQPATLAQVIADGKLLRRLDVDETHVYGMNASELKRVTALLEASPPYLAQRMKLLESRLAGTQKMVLTTSPASDARRWKDAKHIADAGLWLRPYGTLQVRTHLNRPAVLARLKDMLPLYMVYEESVVLRHRDEREEDRRQSETQNLTHAGALGRGRVLQLKGKFLGDDGAMRFYQIARPSNQYLALSSIAPEEKLVKFWGKQDASYWSGLVAYQLAYQRKKRNYDAAIDYFFNRTLLAYPDGPWINGARYNLARCYEASGQTQKAILQYGIDAASPGYLGDRLRAKWLGEEGEGHKAQHK